jgi:AcrR family transcriptional regulator
VLGESGVRERIMTVASELFYRNGVRAVGVDLIVARSGVAKTSLYRHFRTKDDLVAEFLRRQDEEFWRDWDEVSERHPDDARAELDAHLNWIGKRIERPGYRGCPQLNVAAEFPEADHPARAVAKAHKLELRRRLRDILHRIGVRGPDDLAIQLALVIDGAFMSSPVLEEGEATRALLATARALIESD